MTQTAQEEQPDVELQIKIDISPANLERLNKLGLKDNVKRLLWSNIIADSIDNLYHNEEYLGWYVRAGAEEEQETGEQSPKTIIIPVALSDTVYNKYRVRCDDVGEPDVSKQASKDLTDLALSW